jgi:tRNA threonylcarbamoyladenosine biosynthesis protein TsaB
MLAPEPVAILVIDTCLAACQVGIVRAGQLVAGASEPMERGHQERLAPMAAEVMASAGLSFSDVAKIVVTLGPGSFTGLRVGLAFAKGLHVATGAPLAGIGTLAALAASAEGVAAGVIDARRGLVYFQAFDGGRPLGEPEIAPIAEAAEALRGAGRLTLVGPGAALLADALPEAEVVGRAAPDLAALAGLAERAAPAGDPRPLYLRAPDARPLPT